MSANISNHLAGQAEWIRSSQMAQIRSLKSIASLPNSVGSLDFCRSLRNRRKTPALMDENEIAKLQWWYSSREAPSTLNAQARGLRTGSTDFAVDYVDILRANSIPVIWIVPHTNIFDEKVCSLSDILLVLVMQILEVNPRSLAEGNFPVMIPHFQDIESQESEAAERTFDLLARCLAGIYHLYIVVDMTLINAVVNDNSTRANAFLMRLRLIISSRPGVKLVLASWRPVRGLSNQDSESIYQINIHGRLAGLSRQRVNRSSRDLAIGQTALRRFLY
jgi:hypothetical protein